MGIWSCPIIDALMVYLLAQHEIVLAEAQKCPDVKLAKFYRQSSFGLKEETWLCTLITILFYYDWAAALLFICSPFFQSADFNS